MVYLILILVSLVFFLIQFSLSQYFVFTDANLYLYYADQLTKGDVLYKNLYMTNFPLVPYVSVFYKFITLGSVHEFYMTACIEALLSAITLFFCLQKLYDNRFISLAGFTFFLSTFLIFSSANHQNGILLAVLLFTLAYFCYLYKKFLVAGIFLGLALCAKAYMLPLIAAFLVYYYFMDEKKHTLTLLLGSIGAIGIVMLPTLLFAYTDFLHQVFGYSLTRAAGFDKSNIIRSFLAYDPIVVILLLYSLLRWNKQKFLTLATAFSVFFLLYYQDLYLLYFTMFVPLTVLALADLLISIQKRTKKLIIPILLTGLILTINIVNVNRYVESIKGLMAIPNIDQFVKIVQQTHPDYVYGEYGLVQGISYLSGIPMLAGVSETNRKLFLSGVLDKDDITAKLLKTKTTIIAYSDNDNLDIATQSAIVNWQTVKNTCKSVYAQEFRMNPPVNKINIVKCF